MVKKSIDVDEALATLRLPRDVTFDSLPLPVKETLRSRVVHSCGKGLRPVLCPRCHTTDHVVLRYFNNRRSPGQLQPRFRCSNPASCTRKLSGSRSRIHTEFYFKPGGGPPVFTRKSRDWPGDSSSALQGGKSGSSKRRTRKPAQAAPVAPYRRARTQRKRKLSYTTSDWSSESSDSDAAASDESSRSDESSESESEVSGTVPVNTPPSTSCRRRSLRTRLALPLASDVNADVAGAGTRTESVPPRQVKQLNVRVRVNSAVSGPGFRAERSKSPEELTSICCSTNSCVDINVDLQSSSTVFSLSSIDLQSIPDQIFDPSDDLLLFPGASPEKWSGSEAALGGLPPESDEFNYLSLPISHPAIADFLGPTCFVDSL